MRPPRRPRARILSSEETRLWGEVAKLITPLRGRAVPAETPTAAPVPKLPDVSPASLENVRKTPEGKAASASTLPVLPGLSKRAVKLGDLNPSGPVQPTPAPFKPTPPPTGLERRERQKLRRGILPIEARIDLHGLYQAEAHVALVGFLVRAHASGFARVLVVTGKSGEPGATFTERGVLRRSVPHWLRGAELRTIVLGFEEAGRQHGGAGALYVRLRRR